MLTRVCLSILLDDLEWKKTDVAEGRVFFRFGDAEYFSLTFPDAYAGKAITGWVRCCKSRHSFYSCPALSHLHMSDPPYPTQTLRLPARFLPFLHLLLDPLVSFSIVLVFILCFRSTSILRPMR